MTEFEQIYRAYFEDVFRHILRLSRDEHIAEEITSETFFKAMQSIDRFRGDCDLRVWLCQIAKNSYYTAQKNRKRTESLEVPDQLPASASGETPEELLSQKEDTILIQALLHQLPDPYKEVFMWRVFANLSFRQIGGLFHKNDNWACVTYHRARKMIKSKLEELYNEK